MRVKQKEKNKADESVVAENIPDKIVVEYSQPRHAHLE